MSLMRRTHAKAIHVIDDAIDDALWELRGDSPTAALSVLTEVRRQVDRRLEMLTREGRLIGESADISPTLNLRHPDQWEW